MSLRYSVVLQKEIVVILQLELEVELEEIEPEIEPVDDSSVDFGLLVGS